MMFRISSSVILSLVMLACKTNPGKTADAELKADNNAAPAGPLNLGSRVENLLVLNEDDSWMLLELGTRPKKIATLALPTSYDRDSWVYEAVSTKFGNFYVLGDSKIHVVNGKSGKVEASSSVPIPTRPKTKYDADGSPISEDVPSPKALGFEIDTKDSGYLFADTYVAEFNLVTGKEGKKLDTEVDAWLIDGDRIFVATAKNLQIIDKKSMTISKTISLAADKKLTSPIINLTYVRPAEQLMIAGSPKRPRSTGAFAVIDMKTETLKEVDNPATFSGAMFALNQIKRFIHIQHTSTPTSSTHIMMYNMAADGTKSKVHDHGTLYDLFETNDNLSFTADETLSVMTSGCATGFCTAGKGLIFFDLKNVKRLPNISDDFLTGHEEGTCFAGNPDGSRMKCVLPKAAFFLHP